MIYRKNNNNKNIKTIEDYILSQEGQDIIKEIGYVPINN
jgi:ABC-type phosphate transport system substrate-binding protein